MSQESILKLLKRKRKWMTSREIQKELNLGDSAVNRCLNILKNTEDIESKKKVMTSGRKKNFLGNLWRYKK